MTSAFIFEQLQQIKHLLINEYRKDIISIDEETVNEQQAKKMEQFINLIG